MEHGNSLKVITVRIHARFLFFLFLWRMYTQAASAHGFEQLRGLHYAQTNRYWQLFQPTACKSVLLQ